MDNEILSAIAEENIMLRKALSKDTKEKEEGIKFYILSEEPLKISGVLISEGIWKGIKFAYDEMKKVADQFKEVPLIVEHGKVKNEPVGKILEVTPNDCLKALTFTAEITDPEIIQGIKSGHYDAVSIKGAFETVNVDNGIPVGLNFKPIEVSITSSPACDRCLIFNIEQLSKDEKKEEVKAMWKCPFCDKDFEDKEKFKEHLIEEFKNMYPQYGYGYGYEYKYPEAKYGDVKMTIETNTIENSQTATATPEPPKVEAPVTAPATPPAPAPEPEPAPQPPTPPAPAPIVEPTTAQTPAPAPVQTPAPPVQEVKTAPAPAPTPAPEPPKEEPVSIDALIEQARKDGSLLSLATKLFFESVKKREGR